MKIKNINLWIFVLVGSILLIYNTSVKAQINTNVVVTPPYSPFVEDYINTTNITITAIDFGTIECYLNIRIVGDNGVEVSSKTDISYPLFTLYNGIPLILTAFDIQDYFQVQNLNTTGLSPFELENVGLPSGNYQICVQLYNDGVPIGSEACSNYFTIEDLSVNVSTQVIPPFYEDITRYANNSLITLQANRPAKVSLKLKIEGDNGINLQTRPDFFPSELITLSNIPQLISAIDLDEYFQQSSWAVSGISPSELFNFGLPEGNYKLCVSVYENNNLVSQENSGCSNIFNINYLQPPMIISPSDQAVIENNIVQNIVFSWTPSPGAPPCTTYTLKIVEMLDPLQNPNDALLSATTPAFFETEIQGTAFLYGPAQPLLEPGRRYAFQIIASDDESNRRFQNFGKSEVHSFVYGNETEDILIDTVETDYTTDSSIEIFKHDFKLIPNTVISGKLLCKFPDNPNKPLNVINYPNNTQTVIEIPNNTSSSSSQSQKKSKGINYNDAVIVGDEVSSNINQLKVALNINPVVAQNIVKTAKTYFASTESMENTKPLPNTTIKLVGRFAFFRIGTPEDGFVPEYKNPTHDEMIKLYEDMYGVERSDLYKVADVVLDVTQTDEHGDFTFDFRADYFTGYFKTVALDNNDFPQEEVGIDQLEELDWHQYNTVFQGLDYFVGMNSQAGGQQIMSQTIDASERRGYVCLKIEVENQKFCSPDVDILAMPGDKVTLPNQVAKLKTFNLKVVPKASEAANQQATLNQPIDNVKVSIMRDINKLDDEMKMILDYEGQKLDSKTINNNGTFKNVSIDTTGAGDSHVYFKNLVKQCNIDPQYLIELTTRDMNNVETDYENTRYNYRTIFENLPSTTETSAEDYLSAVDYPVYNHLYQPPEVLLEYTMEPLPPEIKGRVMTETNSQYTSLENVRVELIDQIDYDQTFSTMQAFSNAYGSMMYYNNESVLKFEAQTPVNDFGFFRFTNLPIKEEAGHIVGPYRRVYFQNPGYKAQVVPPVNMHPYNINYGQLIDLKDVTLEAAELLRGYVVDEEGNAVAAYVKSEFSPFYITERQIFLGKEYEFFKVPVQHYYNKIIVQPKSSQYFERDTVFNILPTKPMKLTVIKKLHRPEIIVKDPGGNPLQFVKVQIDKQTVFTNSNGIAQFKFASTTDQFIIKITPSGDYVPIQESIQIPVSKDYQQYEYKLNYAVSIQGIVTDKSNNEPIQGAEIYSELKSTDGNVLYLKCTSGSDGKYQLKGIPAGQSNFTFYAVKKGNNPAYAGGSKTINLAVPINKLNSPSYDFKLTRLDGWNLDKIWEYPIVIESFNLVNGKKDEAVISGYIYNPPTIGGFNLQQPDLRLPFSNIQVRKLTNGKVEPVVHSLMLDVVEIPVTINQSFRGNLVNLSAVSYGAFPKLIKQPLKIEKSGDYAEIEGMVKLLPFNFANDFNGIMYLGNLNSNNQVVAFSSRELHILPRYQYNVFSLDNNLNPIPVKDYRVYGFEANAKLGEESYLTGDKIFLSTILHTDIPTCKACPHLDLQINIGEVVITNTDILINETEDNALSFELEKWKVYNQDEWYFDRNEEAVILKKALIVTGSGVDATINNLKIKPTLIGEGDIDMSNGGLSLGGVAKINLSGNLEPRFNYDNTGHYRISVVGSSSANEPAGYISNLPGMEAGKRLEFSSIGLLSNQTNVLSIMKTFRFFNIIDLEVSQIVSGNGYFDLIGTPDPDIPDFIPQMTAMRYTLENGNVVGKMQPIKGFINCPGNVEFTLDEPEAAQNVTNGLYTAYGTFKISPVNTGGSPFYLRGKLEKKNSSCKIDVIKVDAQKLYTGTYAQDFLVGKNVIKITDGKINTINNNKDWNDLIFNGKTTQIKGLNNQNANNNLSFTVFGDIDVSSSNLKVTNIDVGLGKMSLVYDFGENSLHGNLAVHNIELGYATIVDGLMSVKFDNNGYYLAMANTHIRLLQALGLQGGLLLGNSSFVKPSDVSGLVNGFNSKFKPDLNAIEGFYFIGQANLLDIDKKVPVVPVLKVNIKAGAGAYAMGDFNPLNKKVKIGGYVFANASGGFSVELCDFSVHMGVSGNIDGEYNFMTKGLTLKACADGGFGVHVCTYDEDVDFHYTIFVKSNNGIDVGKEFDWGECSF